MPLRVVPIQEWLSEPKQAPVRQFGEAAMKHYVLYPKEFWTTYPAAAHLRNDESLCTRLGRPAIKRIHKQIPFIPPLSREVVDEVALRFEGDNDDLLGSIDELCDVISASTRTTNYLGKTAGEATIKHLAAERDLLRRFV